jgi:hypothetical protein
MRDEVLRRPGAVADDDGTAASGPTGFGAGGADVRRGVDTDDDGAADTLLTVDGADLLVLTDLDDDGLAERVLRLGPDGSVQADPAVAAAVGHPGDPPGLPGPAGDPGDDPAGDPAGDPAAPLAGSAPAHGLWSALLGRLLGPRA